MIDYINSDIIYFLAGTLITIVLFVVGILYNKKLLNKIEVSLVISEWLPIVTTTQDTQFLQLVDYKPSNKTNVYYFKAAVANTGNQDIDKSIIQQGLTIKFPNDFKLVKYKIYSFEDTEVDSSVNSNVLLMDWKLLKPLERNYIELIIETNEIWKQIELEKKLEIKHRIVNLSKIKIFSIYGYDFKSNSEKIKFSNFAMLACTFMLIMWEYFIYKAKQIPLKSLFPSKNFKFEIASNFRRINDSLVVFNVEQDKYAIKINEVAKYFSIANEAENSFSPYIAPIVVTAILFCMMLFINIYERKLRKKAMIIMDNN